MPSPRFALLTAGVWILFGSQPPEARAEQPTYDLIIRGGTVFDGSGLSGRVADVGIDGDRVLAVGNLSKASGRIEKAAAGLYVVPGFISVHDHTDPRSYSRPESLLTQGVTKCDRRGAFTLRQADGVDPSDRATTPLPSRSRQSPS